MLVNIKLYVFWQLLIIHVNQIGTIMDNCMKEKVNVCKYLFLCILTAFNIYKYQVGADSTSHWGVFKNGNISIDNIIKNPGILFISLNIISPSFATIWPQWFIACKNRQARSRGSIRASLVHLTIIYVTPCWTHSHHLYPMYLSACEYRSCELYIIHCGRLLTYLSQQTNPEIFRLASTQHRVRQCIFNRFFHFKFVLKNK